MARTPEAQPDPVRVNACPRRIMLLADGGWRVTWDCGAVRTDGEGSGEWPAVDLEELEANISRYHAHRHHVHAPHRTKVVQAR